MMNAQRSEDYATSEEYLADERVSQQKHEYLAGVIYAMAGASVGHTRIAGNISRHLGNQLSGKPCEAFNSDMKVHIVRDAAEFYYYPDVTVDCGNPQNQQYHADEPRVIFEVLSPATERIDREEKLRNYQTLESLDVYVLVDQVQVAVTLYRRTADGWEREFLTDPQTDAVSLPTIECELSLAAIYERTGLIG